MPGPPASEPSARPLDEPMLDAAEVAALLAVPRRSVYDYAARAHDPLPAVRFGRHVRFARADVERWLVRQAG